MRSVVLHPNFERSRLTEERRTLLTAWFNQELEDALSARSMQEASWRESMRLYAGVAQARNHPANVEGFEPIEVPLGAIATDAIYAHVLDLIYTASPHITVRPMGKEFLDHAKALQRFTNWGTANEWALRPASEHTLFDCVQLGTGVYHIPFVEWKKKTKVNTITSRGPRIVSVPVEDVIVPGGIVHDLQTSRWVAFRSWVPEAEMLEWCESRGWNAEGAQANSTIGWVRSHRERLAGTNEPQHTNRLFEVYETYGYFDIDGDGIQEDCLWCWDRGSRRLLGWKFNPYDIRPGESCRYQLRAHMFYGAGVMDMIRPFQIEATEIHNNRNLNMLIANCRMWLARTGATAGHEVRMWPNKVLELTDPNDIRAEKMGDIYPSFPQAEAITTSLAERRVGINELSMPRPSAVLGSRTPGITALSLLQQSNRRFTPAFDAMRNATSAAVRQCLYRYQERLLAGDMECEAHILKVLGAEDGQLVVDLLRDPDFDEAVSVELTAATPQVNREADRQNSLMLVNILGSYYEKTLQLVALAANPQTPPEVRSVAQKIATSAGEIIERTIRTFDQVRDPELFIVRVDEELDQIEGMSQQGMLGLQQLMQSLASPMGRGQQMLGPEEGPVPVA